jgi:hypothetical protein
MKYINSISSALALILIICSMFNLYIYYTDIKAINDLIKKELSLKIELLFLQIEQTK